MPSTHPKSVDLLGLNIAAGVIWTGPLDASGVPIDSVTDRIQFNFEMLGEGRALSEMERTVEALLQQLQPNHVVLLDAGTSSRSQSTVSTRRRGQMEAVVLIAADRVQVSVLRVTLNSVRQMFGGAPSKSPGLEAVMRALDLEHLSKAAQRAPAFAAALHTRGSQ